MDYFDKKLLYIHLIDEGRIFTSDIEEKYLSGKNFLLHLYPSAEKLFTDAASEPLYKQGRHVVILAVQLGSPDKIVKSGLIKEIQRLIPGVNVINLCHPRELEKGISSLRNGNVIHIANNENALIRIDNALRWVLAKTNLDSKRRLYKITAGIFIISVILTAAVITIYFSIG